MVARHRRPNRSLPNRSKARDQKRNLSDIEGHNADVSSRGRTFGHWEWEGKNPTDAAPFLKSSSGLIVVNMSQSYTAFAHYYRAGGERGKMATIMSTIVG